MTCSSWLIVVSYWSLSIVSKSACFAHLRIFYASGKLQRSDMSNMWEILTMLTKPGHFLLSSFECVPQTAVFYSSAYLFILPPQASCLHCSPDNRPLPAWCPSSPCPPGRWHQTPPCPTSLPFCRPRCCSPHVTPPLALFSALLWPTVPCLLPSYTSLVCLCLLAHPLPPRPSSPGQRRADKAPDYLCVAASVLCSD